MRSLLPTAALGLVAAGIVAAPAKADPINYMFTLAPENNSGVTGSGTMVLNGTMLTVNVTATGLTANEPHPMHIHGLLGAAAPSTRPAPPSADAPPNGNGDGYVEKPEGAPYSGPPIFGLPATGTPGGYSTAPGGVISFTQTYNLANTALYDPDGMGLSLTLADIEGTTGGNTVPLVDRIIEIHGLAGVPASAAALNGTTVEGPGNYDMMMPVAAGIIQLAVPEPGSIAVLGGGLAALALLGLGRKRA